MECNLSLGYSLTLTLNPTPSCGDVYKIKKFLITTINEMECNLSFCVSLQQQRVFAFLPKASMHIDPGDGRGICVTFEKIPQQHMRALQLSSYSGLG